MPISQQPETVRDYLNALTQALRAEKCPPGLIVDALNDCEEHLRNEIAQNPGVPEAEVLASVVETYGTPAEIAEEYKSMEATLSGAGPFPKSEQPQDERPYGFFNVLSDPRTYGALVYMLLSLATGIFYFTWTVVGISLTIGFAILIIGIPFALLFIGSVRVLAHVEGRIVEALLGVRMPRRLPATTQGEETIWARIGDALSDIRTWSSMLYLLLMLPLGVAYFVIAVVGLACSIGVTGGALWGLITGHVSIQMDGNPYLEHFLHTAPGLIVFAIGGLLLFFVVLHIARGIGALHGRIAELLLVRL
ncbi:MAG TPA: sensor domain-containing protein [Rhizomicrobium sp.]|nr:sensor domain-containing protein [Rhizomicrobium sp.]